MFLGNKLFSEVDFTIEVKEKRPPNNSPFSSQYTSPPFTLRPVPVVLIAKNLIVVSHFTNPRGIILCFAHLRVAVWANSIRLVVHCTADRKHSYSSFLNRCVCCGQCALPNFITSDRVHYVQQTLIAVYIVVHHLACGHLVEQLLGTRDFCLLNWSLFRAFHRVFFLPFSRLISL